MKLSKGYVQVYTGDGKGKTTASLGLALRAAGAGMKVYIGQFLKSGDYSEIQALKALGDRITVAQFGSGRLIRGQPGEKDRALAAQGLAAARQALAGGCYDLVILDEANVAAAMGLVSFEELIGLVKEKPAAVELVLTGRGASPELMAAADLVTEMKAVRHYYEAGVNARQGIEK
jgi:cob(I)alamin adenosyltransferase